MFIKGSLPAYTLTCVIPAADYSNVSETCTSHDCNKHTHTSEYEGDVVERMRERVNEEIRLTHHGFNFFRLCYTSF